MFAGTVLGLLIPVEEIRDAARRCLVSVVVPVLCGIFSSEIEMSVSF